MVVNDWWTTTSNALEDVWNRIVTFLPNLIGALVIIVIGWIIAWVIKQIIERVVQAIRAQQFFDQVGFTTTLKKAGIPFKADQAAGVFVQWLIVILFLLPAAEVLGLESIYSIVNAVINYIPSVVTAVILILVGVTVADFLAGLVRAGSASIGSTSAKTLAAITKYVMYIFIALAALVQLQVLTSLVNILFIGLVSSIALASGLAFGLGGREAASDLIANVRKEFNQK